MHCPLRLPAILLTLTTASACSPDSDPGVSPGAPTTGTTGATAVDPDPTTTPTTTGTSGPGDSSTTTDGTSTTDAGTGSTTRDTGLAPGPSCGDGHIDPGEQCDDSYLSNSNSAACTLQCLLNVCGDGFEHEGEEDCDWGPNNNNNVYGGCRTDCRLSDHCGDSQVQGPEECDLGPNNGTGKAELGGAACDETCRYAAKLVFLSSEVYAAYAVGSAASADGRCKALAAAAGLDNPKGFMAWLSDGASSPATRFTPSLLPLVLLNGVRVANHTQHLLDNGPLVGITHTDQHEEIPYREVWTATNPDGTLFNAGLTCDNWNSDNFQHQARVGRSGVDPADKDAWATWDTEKHWTSFDTVSCHEKYHIYCMEQ